MFANIHEEEKFGVLFADIRVYSMTFFLYVHSMINMNSYFVMS
jgi:hypothetical protein